MRLLGAILLVLSVPAFGQVPKSQQGFDGYRMIRLRNIFDPQRSPVAQTSSAPQAPVATPPPKAGDFVVLTGVMFDGGKALAFFSGSRPDYDKVLQVNGDIAGAKLAKITLMGIEVEREGKDTAIAIGQTVPFDNSAPGLPPASFAADAASPAPAGGDSSSQSSTTLPASTDAVMRWMMERRQQELR
jgi:hypothetical protein